MILIRIYVFFMHVLASFSFASYIYKSGTTFIFKVCHTNQNILVPLFIAKLFYSLLVTSHVVITTKDA